MRHLCYDEMLSPIKPFTELVETETEPLFESTVGAAGDGGGRTGERERGEG